MQHSANHAVLASCVLAFILCTVKPDYCTAKETLTFSTAEKSDLQTISALVLSRAYGQIGFDLRINEYPNARSLLIANAGEVDGELSRIAGLETKFDHLRPVPTPVNVVHVSSFGLIQNEFSESLGHLGKARLGCVRGVKIVETFILEQELDCINFNHIDQALKVLSLGRIEQALLPELNGTAAITRLKLGNVKELRQKLASQHLYHYLHQSQSHLIKPLDEILQVMQQEGEIEKIRRRYLEEQIKGGPE